ncbi:MAG: hypothetical protein ACK4M3_03525 [Pyrobaculum sp.]
MWLYTVFASGVREFSKVTPVSVYLDSSGDFVVCVYNAGPHDFYGVLVVSASSGKSVDIQLYVKVGELAEARGSLGESYTPGSSPVLYVVTGGGNSYPVSPIVVPDVSGVRCK